MGGTKRGQAGANGRKLLVIFLVTRALASKPPTCNGPAYSRHENLSVPGDLAGHKPSPEGPHTPGFPWPGKENIMSTLLSLFSSMFTGGTVSPSIWTWDPK